jgi:hypothetical protein
MVVPQRFGGSPGKFRPEVRELFLTKASCDKEYSMS